MGKKLRQKDYDKGYLDGYQAGFKEAMDIAKKIVMQEVIANDETARESEAWN